MMNRNSAIQTQAIEESNQSLAKESHSEVEASSSTVEVESDQTIVGQIAEQ